MYLATYVAKCGLVEKYVRRHIPTYLMSTVVLMFVKEHMVAMETMLT